MENNEARHLIARGATVRQAMRRLDELAVDAVLFLTDEQDVLVGALTDGDVRRYLLNGGAVDDEVQLAAFTNFKFVRQRDLSLRTLQDIRKKGILIIPVLDAAGRLVEIFNFRTRKSLLPVDAVIMAGGVGSRLRPLTNDVPKPLLPVGGKPIVEHNIDRLKAYGVEHLTISIKYLGQQLVDYFGDGRDRGMSINYVAEEEPRGTIGAISEIDGFTNDYVLVMNSDLLTTIDFEAMFLHCLDHDADMAVATIPYEVKVPYGVIEHDQELVTGLREKPTFTYYSNAGIYILKKEHVGLVPKSGRFGAPDLMKALYSAGKRVVHYPIVGYWLDIGKHHDYQKAQEDIKKLKL